jgi:hypothetical protein
LRENKEEKMKPKEKIIKMKKHRDDTSNIVQKKKLPCQFYVHGSCNKGHECPFSHEITQVKKTNELCKYFLTGSCLKGDECLYSHNTMMFPCKFFHAIGYCESGDNCK